MENNIKLNQLNSMGECGYAYALEKCVRSLGRETPKERDHQGDLGVHWRVILKWILNDWYCTLWTGFRMAQNENLW